MMEASEQGEGIGRERLFVQQLIFCQVTFFNLLILWLHYH